MTTCLLHGYLDVNGFRIITTSAHRPHEIWPSILGQMSKIHPMMEKRFQVVNLSIFAVLNLLIHVRKGRCYNVVTVDCGSGSGGFRLTRST